MDMDLLPVAQLEKFSNWLDRIGLIDAPSNRPVNSIVKMHKTTPDDSIFSVKAISAIAGNDFVMIEELWTKGRSKLLAEFKKQRRESADEQLLTSLGG